MVQSYPNPSARQGSNTTILWDRRRPLSRNLRFGLTDVSIPWDRNRRWLDPTRLDVAFVDDNGGRHLRFTAIKNWGQVTWHYPGSLALGQYRLETRLDCRVAGGAPGSVFNWTWVDAEWTAELHYG